MNPKKTLEKKFKIKDLSDNYFQKIDQSSFKHDENSFEKLFEIAKFKIEIKDVAGFDRILTRMHSINSNHPLIYALKGLISLYNGDCSETYNNLFKYLNGIKSTLNIDLSVLEMIGIFNLSTEKYHIALKQFTYLLLKSKNRETKISSLFKIAICKKRLGNHEIALNILNTLIALPEGYRNFLVVYLETIHNKILLGHFNEAELELENYIHLKNHAGVVRLYVYVLYKLGKYNELISYANLINSDLYVDYILLRVRMDINQSDPELEKSFDLLISLTKNNFAIITTYANYKICRGQYYQAMKYYEMALHNNYTYLAAKENHDYLLSRFGMEKDPEFALSQVKSSVILEIVDGNPELESIGFFKQYLKDGFVDFIFNKTTFDSINTIDFYIKDFEVE